MLSHCVLLPTPEAAADYEQFLRSLSATDIAQEAYLEGDANQLIVSFQTVTKVAVKILVEHIFKLESYALKMAGSYDGFDLIAAKPA